MSPRDPDLVQVAFAPNQMIADMWHDVLHQEGIPSVIRTADTSAYLGAMTPSTLHVPPEHANRARELLTASSDDGRDEVDTVADAEHAV